jgi:hypothetical protein
MLSAFMIKKQQCDYGKRGSYLVGKLVGAIVGWTDSKLDIKGNE